MVKSFNHFSAFKYDKLQLGSSITRPAVRMYQQALVRTLRTCLADHQQTLRRLETKGSNSSIALQIIQCH